MRRIEVVEQPCESVLFSIDKVAFRYNQENKKTDDKIPGGA